MVELVQFLVLLSIGQPVAEGYHSNTSHDHTETTTFGTTLKRRHLEPHDIESIQYLEAHNIWNHTTFGTILKGRHLESHDIWNHMIFGSTRNLEPTDIWKHTIFGTQLQPCHLFLDRWNVPYFYFRFFPDAARNPFYTLKFSFARNLSLCLPNGCIIKVFNKLGPA